MKIQNGVCKLLFKTWPYNQYFFSQWCFVFYLLVFSIHSAFTKAIANPQLPLSCENPSFSEKQFQEWIFKESALLNPEVSVQFAKNLNQAKANLINAKPLTRCAVLTKGLLVRSLENAKIEGKKAEKTYKNEEEKSLPTLQALAVVSESIFPKEAKELAKYISLSASGDVFLESLASTKPEWFLEFAELWIVQVGKGLQSDEVKQGFGKLQSPLIVSRFLSLKNSERRNFAQRYYEDRKTMVKTPKNVLEGSTKAENNELEVLSALNTIFAESDASTRSFMEQDFAFFVSAHMQRWLKTYRTSSVAAQMRLLKLFPLLLKSSSSGEAVNELMWMAGSHKEPTLRVAANGVLDSLGK